MYCFGGLECLAFSSGLNDPEMMENAPLARAQHTLNKRTALLNINLCTGLAWAHWEEQWIMFIWLEHILLRWPFGSRSETWEHPPCAHTCNITGFLYACKYAKHPAVISGLVIFAVRALGVVSRNWWAGAIQGQHEHEQTTAETNLSPYIKS